MFGSNYYGQLGIGDERHSYNAPIKVMENIEKVKTGKDITIAVSKDGSLWGFGKNIGSVPTKLLENVKDASFNAIYISYIDRNGDVYLKTSDKETFKIAENGEIISKNLMTTSVKGMTERNGGYSPLFPLLRKCDAVKLDPQEVFKYEIFCYARRRNG